VPFTLLYLVLLPVWRSTLTTVSGIWNANLSMDERVLTASKVYSLVQMYFFAPKPEPPPYMEASFGTYVHRIVSNDDRRQFDLATIEFVAQLRSGHTFFWDTWLEKDNSQPLGFYAKTLEGKWVVQATFLNTLKLGDVLSKIDNVTVEAFFLQQRRYISASSTAAQRQNLFLLPYLFPEQFTLTLENGTQVAINRAALKKPPDRTNGRWLKSGSIAYIHIPSFFDPSLEQEAFDYVKQFHKAGTLVIDVRENSGGIPPKRLMWELMDRPYHGWRKVPIATTNAVHPAMEGGTGESHYVLNAPRESLGSQNSLGDSKLTTPNPNAFRGRLILLVNGGCVSACEDFVEPLKETGRATLVGETTQGSSGPPFIYDFGNGMSLRIAVTRYYFPDGSEFEGVGIKPDVEVHTTIEDLKNRRDPTFQKALELAADK
jgi:carboxyl-terminal processing protease